MLATSNFFFTQNVFSPLSPFCFVVCKFPINVDKSKILSFGNGLTVSQMTNFRLYQTERVLEMIISNLMKMAENSLNGWKTLWEKEKLFLRSNFSFSHSVFKRLVRHTRKNQGLFGNELRGAF